MRNQLQDQQVPQFLTEFADDKHEKQIESNQMGVLSKTSIEWRGTL